MRSNIGYVLVLIVVLVTTCSFSSSESNPNQELKIVRIGFYKATQDSRNAELLLKIIEKLQSKSPVIKAYEGATLALMAKDKWNPFVAIKLLKKARTRINLAVKESPKNLEIRFIRFAVQKNIPKFLGLSENIVEDKAFVVNNISRFNESVLNKKMKSYILKFMIEQGGCSDEQIAVLKKKLS